jgi:purine-binding chemotaxis protein CheW
MQAGDSTILTGIIVDNVEEVIDIAPSDIEPPPQYNIGMDLSFLKGIGKVKEQVVMIINVSKLLSVGELEKLENI